MIVGLKEAQWIFNVVFFIVLTSALLQGWTIPYMAKLLKLDVPSDELVKSPPQINYLDKIDREIIFLIVPDLPSLKNKSLVEIPELKGSLIATISWKNKYFVPSGGTILEPEDEIQVLAEKEKIHQLKSKFSITND